MSYKIAVGSSDEKNVDLKFGEVSEFLIYEVDGLSYNLTEKRTVTKTGLSEAGEIKTEGTGSEAITTEVTNTNGCGGNKEGCASGSCSGNGQGCSGPSEVTGKVEVISDCRAVVCKRIGFQAQKQFEKKAISVFDVECEIKDALEKITTYYDKLDRKISLKRG